MRNPGAVMLWSELKNMILSSPGLATCCSAKLIPQNVKGVPEESMRRMILSLTQLGLAWIDESTMVISSDEELSAGCEKRGLNINRTVALNSEV